MISDRTTARAPLAFRLAPARPLAPERLGAGERVLRVDRARRRQMRRPMRQDERHRLSGRDVELADRGQVLAGQRHRRVQDDHVGAGDRAKRAVLHPRHPRNGMPEVEPQHELGSHLQPPSLAAHEPDDVGVAAARRHEINDRGGAVGGLDACLEDQGLVAILSRDPRILGRALDRPAAVLGSVPRSAAKQALESNRGQHSQSIEPLRRDQRGRLAVADERVVFNPCPRVASLIVNSSMQEGQPTAP